MAVSCEIEGKGILVVKISMESWCESSGGIRELFMRAGKVVMHVTWRYSKYACLIIIS